MVERHRFVTTLPAQFDPRNYRTLKGADISPSMLTDEARNPGGTPKAVFELGANAGVGEVSHIVRSLKDGENIKARGAGSAITGSSIVPKEDENSYLIDMNARQKLVLEGDLLFAESGATLHQIHEFLEMEGKYHPRGSTFVGATIGGNFNTNASGASTFKYGATRAGVEGFTAVLANGDVLTARRGQFIAHEDGYFEWENSQGKVTRIDIPTYQMPDVAKNSAGYFAQPGMDLVDLFVGSEGTLGVITEVVLKVEPKPPIVSALIACEDERQALDLTKRLREASKETRELRQTAIEASQTPNVNGIDVSAIEYMDPASTKLLKDDGALKDKAIENARTLLLVQLELNPNLDPNDYDMALNPFLQELDERNLIDSTSFAMPNERAKREEHINVREALPLDINRRVAELKRDNRPFLRKLAVDSIVPFEKMEDMIVMYREAFQAAGLEVYIFGHVSDGNMHPNVIPLTEDSFDKALEILWMCGERVIREMFGSTSAEHGIGQNELKQRFLELMVTSDGILQMQKVKKALDPDWKLAPGNIFPKAA